MKDLDKLIGEAGVIYSENFSNETWFERALFFSWSCAIKDCTFCFMSTQEKKNRNDNDRSLRSKESLYAETILCKKLGWRIGFFSGGINSYGHKDILEMLRVIAEIIEDKEEISPQPSDLDLGNTTRIIIAIVLIIIVIGIIYYLRNKDKGKKRRNFK